eukprot:GILI01028630.1.p1 GENE.GILI01028630.1~~GILI01028630.1.p1  ORF type:complete len:382 (+),score=78.20 GILI01028630.1:114-1259(+)
MSNSDEVEAIMVPVVNPIAGPTGSAGTKAERRPWVEKYRPTQLEQLVAHEDILSTLKRLLDSGSMPHLLFYGPPGTGKTTTIQACARMLFGNRVKGNVLELNASDDRGIDIVRNEIKEFASTGSIGGSGGFFGAAAATSGGVAASATASKTNFKLIILDEADQMSHDAQAALRRVIERYTKNARFCIICNHANKIIPAVQSRCTRFRFSPLNKQMLPRLQFIMTEESIPFDLEGLQAAVKLSCGDMRRCLNLLQACALSTGKVSVDTIYDVSGYPRPKDVELAGTSMLQTPFVESYEFLQGLVEAKGISMVDFITELHPAIMRLGVPQQMKWFATTKLADFEHQLASGASETLIMSGVVGMMQILKESVAQNKSPFELAAT